MSKRTQTILLICGGFVLLLELLVLVAFLLSRNDSVPQSTHTQVDTVQPVRTTEEATEATEEINWYDIPDAGQKDQGPLVEKNRFTSTDFGYQDGYLTCLAEPCVMGIDVSSYQGSIDWNQVKEAGFDFVMIRVGGRGYGEAGNFFIDSMADTYYEGAKAAGLQVGAYFFSQALNEEEALAEAELALRLTETWELDLPIAFDWEYVTDEGRTASPDMYRVAMCTQTFCEAIKEAGREPMVYLSLWFGYPYFEELMDYPIWLALYTDEMDYEYRFDMWQYTSSGRVPGIDGDVDINIYFPPK